MWRGNKNLFGHLFALAMFGVVCASTFIAAAAGFIGWHLFWALYAYVGGL